MNTATTPTPKQLPPFAAVVHFRDSALFQQKHKSWTFRSDYVCPLNTPVHKQYEILENYILRTIKDTYETATIFDNCGKSHVFYGEERAKNNLVLQVNYGRITIDNRRYLDLSWMEHTYDKFFLEFLADTFAVDKYVIDLRASQLHEWAELYKQETQNQK